MARRSPRPPTLNRRTPGAERDLLPAGERPRRLGALGVHDRRAGPGDRLEALPVAGRERVDHLADGVALGLGVLGAGDLAERGEQTDPDERHELRLSPVAEGLYPRPVDRIVMLTDRSPERGAARGRRARGQGRAALGRVARRRARARTPAVRRRCRGERRTGLRRARALGLGWRARRRSRWSNATGSTASGGRRSSTRCCTAPPRRRSGCASRSCDSGTGRGGLADHARPADARRRHVPGERAGASARPHVQGVRAAPVPRRAPRACVHAARADA